MIGAMELSKWCYDLEVLGNNEDIEELQKRTPKMLELYRSYKEVLKSYAVCQNEEKEEVSKEKIVEALRGIITAIDTFDLDLADEIMKQLEGYRLEETIEEKISLMTERKRRQWVQTYSRKI